jgi:hypothetical protein
MKMINELLSANTINVIATAGTSTMAEDLNALVEYTTNTFTARQVFDYSDLKEAGVKLDGDDAQLFDDYEAMLSWLEAQRDAERFVNVAEGV